MNRLRWPGRRGSTWAQVPVRQGGHQWRQLRRRRDRNLSVVESEGNGRMCLTLPET